MLAHNGSPEFSILPAWLAPINTRPHERTDGRTDGGQLSKLNYADNLIWFVYKTLIIGRHSDYIVRTQIQTFPSPESRVESSPVQLTRSVPKSIMTLLFITGTLIRSFVRSGRVRVMEIGGGGGQIQSSLYQQVANKRGGCRNNRYFPVPIMHLWCIPLRWSLVVIAVSPHHSPAAVGWSACDNAQTYHRRGSSRPSRPECVTLSLKSPWKWEVFVSWPTLRGNNSTPDCH